MSTNNFSQVEGQEQKILDTVNLEEIFKFRGKVYNEAEILKAFSLLEQYKKNQAEVKEVDDIIKKLQKIKDLISSGDEKANLTKCEQTLENYKNRLLKR